MVDSEDAVVIAPDGHIGLCEHYMDSHFVGHIDSEKLDQEIVKQLREYCEEIPECNTCAYYPRCYRLKICGSMPKECFVEWREDAISSIRHKMLREYHELMKDNS